MKSTLLMMALFTVATVSPNLLVKTHKDVDPHTVFKLAVLTKKELSTSLSL